MVDLAQILISHGHPPETVGGYAICTIEAFVESIMHLENLNGRRELMANATASQGTAEAVEKYLKSLPTKKVRECDDTEGDEDRLLRDFQAGFKGAK